jgi:hypothetical protein
MPLKLQEIPRGTPAFEAVMKGKAVYHKGCGGQVMIDSALHGLADLAFGFVGKKFEIKKKYSKRVAGYLGVCLKCEKEGRFMLDFPS